MHAGLDRPHKRRFDIVLFQPAGHHSPSVAGGIEGVRPLLYLLSAKPDGLPVGLALQ